MSDNFEPENPFKSEQPQPKTAVAAAESRGLKIEHFFSTPDEHPFDQIEWETRSAKITNETGEAIFEQNEARGGETAHACMPGCQIKCSNVYVDKAGEEVVSPLEYETIGVLGTNCGLKDPDDVAHLNAICNDLGVDSIEAGALFGVMMGAGDSAFGDMDFMRQALNDMLEGNERGRELAQGVAHYGEAHGIARVPVIKKQALSAYDPRVTEVTAMSMMTTTQGADHTAGNNPTFVTEHLTLDDIARESFMMQIYSAANDGLGLCLFGRAVSNANQDMMIGAVNDALGTDLDGAFYKRLGYETLLLERQFNLDAGFTVEDNALPQFFTEEPLPPTNKTSRLTAQEVTRMMDKLLDDGEY